MIVYVESNFVLEAVLQQREMTAIEALLVLAENRKIELAFPGFALSEPFATLMHIHSNRQRLGNSSDLKSILDQLQQSERSENHQKVASDLRISFSNLTKFAEHELDLLQRTIEKMLEVGQTIGIDRERFKKAQDYQLIFDLQPIDSVIYASVFLDAQLRDQDEQKCFLSRNSRDFGTQDVSVNLVSVNCKYFSSFTNGFGYIQSRLRSVG